MSFFISDAFAATGSQAAAGGGMGSIIILGVFILFFYLILLRPQQKRAKEHRNMIAAITKGDEVITSGGLLGKVVKLDEQFIVINIAKDIDVTIQKSAISMTLPKGTMKSATA